MCPDVCCFCTVQEFGFPLNIVSFEHAIPKRERAFFLFFLITRRTRTVFTFTCLLGAAHETQGPLSDQTLSRPLSRHWEGHS